MRVLYNCIILNRKFCRYWALVFILLVPSEVKTATSAQCDPGETLSMSEKKELISKLRITNAGKKLIFDFESKYSSIEKININWGESSYSQVLSKDLVCVHLAKKLPDIEHLADFSHELVHITRLESKVLRGEQSTAEEFIRARIQSPGGEADAFATECQVKREALGEWDSFCKPYVNQSNIDVEKVVDALYTGQLAASLTGEPYPQMLTQQFNNIQQNQKRTPAKSN